MKFGDTFICRFPFTSGAVSKPRPVLVQCDVGNDAVMCRITSVQHAGPLDASLPGWAAAGLAKPSIAWLNCLVTAEKSLLPFRLDESSQAGKNVIRSTWNPNMMML